MIPINEQAQPMLKHPMEYHNEMITISSLREDAANHRKLQTKTEQLNKNPHLHKIDLLLELNEDNYLLTTKEACELLRCSKATLWKYAKDGTIQPWQRKKRGLTRWPRSQLRKI